MVMTILRIASLNMLPAILAVRGNKADALRLPIIGGEKDKNGGIRAALTKRVLAKTAIFAAVTTTMLVAVAIPAFSLDLSFARGSDAFHDAVQGKRALQLLEENFSAGLASPAYVVVEASNIDAPAVQDSVDNMIQALAQDDRFTLSLIHI